MNARVKLTELSKLFESHAVEDHAKEAEALIIETLRINKSKLYTSDIELSDSEAVRIDSYAARRIKGEPLQYIIGHVELYGLKINVGKGVLIPRPETELLADETVKLLRQDMLHIDGQLAVLDLCSGSGFLALAIAMEFPDATVLGIDLSETAVMYSLKNAEENRVHNVRFLHDDLFAPVAGMKFHCIVSNPPYIRSGDIAGLQREIRDYEPAEALDGGGDGLDFYRRIFTQASEYLKGNGLLMLEIGHDQAEDIHGLAVNNGFSDVRFIRDYSGIKRIFVGRPG